MEKQSLKEAISGKMGSKLGVTFKLKEEDSIE
jgi:hypothetical protein